MREACAIAEKEMGADYWPYGVEKNRTYYVVKRNPISHPPPLSENAP